MRQQLILTDTDANCFFAEIEEEDNPTAIIIENGDIEIDMYCDVEQAEALAKQLQTYIRKYKMRTGEGRHDT